MDLSPEVGAIAGSDAGGGSCDHNHSWLTLKELLDFPWHENVRRCGGYVDAEDYARFKEVGRPGRLHGEAINALTNEEMDEVIEGRRPGGDGRTYIEFGIPYAEFCGQLLTQTIPVLRTFGDPDDVRIVFWFDS